MGFSVCTEIANYETFQKFAESECLLASDLIITNEFIFNPFVKPCQVPCQVIFQEKYGAGEPNDQMIDAIRADIPKNVKRIIAIGGGTVIDIGKILVFDGHFSTEQMFTGEVVPEKVRSLIVIPTTCGTGSEVTNLTIVELKSLKTKKGLGLKSMYPDKAALIPEMVRTLPFKFFATSSIDALIHAVESMVSPKSSMHTEVFAVQAIQLIVKGYQAIVAKGLETWPELASDFLVASNFAGIAFGNAGVGAVHALSYPLGGAYHIPHGEANQLMFTGVFKAYKAKKPTGKINVIEAIIAGELNVSPNQAFDALDELMQKVLKRKGLEEYGITRGELDVFSKSVISGQQRLLANNYVELTEADIRGIYESCY